MTLDNIKLLPENAREVNLRLNECEYRFGRHWLLLLLDFVRSLFKDRYNSSYHGSLIPFRCIYISYLLTLRTNPAMYITHYGTCIFDVTCSFFLLSRVVRSVVMGFDLARSSPEAVDSRVVY